MAAPPNFGDDLTLGGLERLIARHATKRCGALGGTGGDPARRRNGPRAGESRVPYLIATDAIVDEPDALGLSARYQPTGEQQVHGSGVADLVGKLHRAAARRHDTPAGLGKSEAGILGGNADVAGEDE